MAEKAPTRSNLSLRGSSKTVAEFFEFSINSILYQRGIYPADDFTMVKKYGLNLLVTCDDEIKSYIRKIMQQLNRWVINDTISRLVLVILSKDSGEVVERWQFDIQVFDDNSRHKVNEAELLKKSDRTNEEITKEIQAIIRQITASVTFLPSLETGDYTFNVLVYADADAKVPNEWIDSDSKEIKNEEKVKFRSLTTNNHKIDTLVSYKFTTTE